MNVLPFFWLESITILIKYIVSTFVNLPVITQTAYKFITGFKIWKQKTNPEDLSKPDITVNDTEL